MADERTASFLRTLHLPKTCNSSGPVDIVAVHGLDGDCVNSWTHTPKLGSSTLWLRDLLPKQLPSCHVMTFQYDATNLGNLSAHGVRENAGNLIRFLANKREDQDAEGRPIVFLGHSLGGIIIKQALRMAHDNPQRFDDIAKSTKGIVFFGTPHRGADSAKWLYLLSSVVSTVRHQHPSRFVETLQTNSADLLKISEDFLPLAHKYALISYYEEHIDRVLNAVVVEKLSAVMGIAHEESALMGGTHVTMCKFGKNDPRFDDVWRSIRRASKGRVYY